MNLTTVLHYNPETGRMAIGEHDLHCGDCFQLMAASDPNGDPVWWNVRIELYNAGDVICQRPADKERWYLIGLPNDWPACANDYILFYARFHP